MDEERPRKWDHLKNWLQEYSKIRNWAVAISGFTLVLFAIQTYHSTVAKRVQLRSPSDPLFLRQGTNKLFGTGFDS